MGAASAMKPEEQNKTLKAWQTSSQYWEKYRDVIAQMFAPLTAALIEDAHIKAGQTVLDIGGGSGEPSLTIAQIVGPKGSVMYTDPVAGMVEVAHAEANRRRLRNIQFRQCSGDQLPFADDTFDVVVSRLSAMFFPDPAAGVAEALRVVRKDGCVAFVVWSSKHANPFFSVVTDVLDQFVQAPISEPDAPDMFRFAERGKLAGILENAGAKSVVERCLNFAIEAPVRPGIAYSFDQFWQMRTEMSDTLRERLAGVTPDQVARIKSAVADKAQKYFSNAAMSFPAEALIVSGRGQ
jgi:ubiquinone/menaquinone biosynthesis C-methylase UbiE